MKTTIKKVALIIAATGCLTFAEAQKIAHVNLDSLVSGMPETKIASDAAQTYFKGLEQESIAMQTELENKYKDYMEKEAGMSDLLKKTKNEDLQQLQRRIEDFRNQATQDYQRKTAELTAPIMDKARKAIESVAKEGGYKYVLDTSSQNPTVLYSEPSDDILAAVKKKLDAMPAAVIPGVTPPNTGGIKGLQGGNKPPAPKGK
ncbi:MAG TPA: OmpH family outer membrane protein [Bacteroidia bacterium]|nr:OmpH family outer membrane protein [Bacteroidia bacterium]